MRYLEQWLYLRPGELALTAPFFLLYLAVFAALTLADGLFLALFLERAGAERLPFSYGMMAVTNLILIGIYLPAAERVDGLVLFLAILAGTAALGGIAWYTLARTEASSGWYVTLIIGREAVATLTLLHFGTYLQDDFRREELNRVLPIVYAGGRVGGMVGGWVLISWSAMPADAVIALVALTMIAMALAGGIFWYVPYTTQEQDEDADEEQPAHTSLAGFLRFAWTSPLLFWLTTSSTLFMLVRWLLNYRYSQFFAAHFDDAGDLAAFLGRYTQVALFLALLVQLFVVNRLVVRLGVGGAYLGYTGLVFATSVLAAPTVTLTSAMLLRLVENELRFAVRNPLMQLLSNQFGKSVRIRVRAWTMGLLSPVGTACAACLLAALSGSPNGMGWVTAAAAFTLLVSAVGVQAAGRTARCQES